MRNLYLLFKSERLTKQFSLSDLSFTSTSMSVLIDEESPNKKGSPSKIDDTDQDLLQIKDGSVDLLILLGFDKDIHSSAN